MLTGLKFVVAIPMAIHMAQGSYLTSLLLVAVIAALDFADGAAARKFNAVSEFGKVFDSAADKFCVLLGLLAMGSQLVTSSSKIGADQWIVALLSLSLLLAIAEAILFLIAYHKFSNPSTNLMTGANRFGKVKMGFEIGTLIGGMLFLKAVSGGGEANWFVPIMADLTIISLATAVILALLSINGHLTIEKAD